jgi:hypothetical protein
MIDTSTLYIINVSFVNSIDEAKDLTQDVVFIKLGILVKGTLNFQLAVFCHL